MKPVEFVLWLNGAAELVGDQPPTPEQWATMREKLGEAVGGLVAARLLERAEETLRADARRENDKAQVYIETQTMLGLTSALPVITTFEVPEMPEPHNLVLTDHILVKDST